MVLMDEKIFKNYPYNIKYKIETSVDLVNNFIDYDENYFKDWSFVVFPIIVALEGYIKWLSIKSNVKFKKKINFFDLREKPYKIKSNIDYDKSFTNLINILEDCYNIYINI